MASRLMVLLALLLLKSQFYYYSKAQSWIRSGYWLTVSEYPVPDIDSSLFTHLFCAFAGINSTTYQLSIPSSDQRYFSSFTATVKLKNPSIQTLLSIGDSQISNTFLSMISNSSARRSFVKSSIDTAKKHGFNGLDICCFEPNTTSDSLNMAALFDEWRSAVNNDDSHRKLILTMGLHYIPILDHNLSYPVDFMQRNFDWVHLMSFDYFVPLRDKFVHPHAALYDPYNGTDNHKNTDYGIRQWLNRGLSADKILIGLPYHGWVWTLVDPHESQIGSRAFGPGITADGSMSFKYIKGYVQSYKADIVYNSSYVEHTCTFSDFWIGFDDVDAIKTKVSYAKETELRGYNVFQVANDDNWVLSKTAAQTKGEKHLNKRLLLIKVLIPVALIMGFLGTSLFICRTKLLSYTKTLAPNVKNFGSDLRNLKVFTFVEISAATNDFSYYNKLGEGGYGPVYKGKLRTGQEIAVKRLSKASSQGFEEFKNEVMLTARLQHVNLVRVMGFCVENEEKMLIYEYLPNKSLDLYLFDPIKRLQLDWEKRINIIEGIQGLLYLQEYSRLTIIHRDLKAANILLDKELRPKISDFGMARIFHKDGCEANTSRIVGTYGYVPPEYVKQGAYSTKYDVYSFGVLLLQIISGKRNSYFYGANEDLNIMEYAYELWLEGQGMEFIDPSLDDSCSSKYKLMRCMHVGLLCVQEKQEDRPSMLEVLAMLTNETEPTMIPRRPAFSINAHTSKQNPISLTQNSCSCCHSLASDLEPR